MTRIICLFILLISAPQNLVAGELRTETTIETRAREIASKLRCPVCQGESVYDSHSAIAREMKAIIIEKVAAGESAPAIMTYFQERYGDYILMRPKLDRNYAILWFAPLIIVVLAICIYLWRLRTRQPEIPEDDIAELDADQVFKELNEVAK